MVSTGGRKRGPRALSFAKRAAPTCWAILADEGHFAGTLARFAHDSGWSHSGCYITGREWEIEFMMCPAYQGRGIAYTACCQALDIFEPLVQPRRIYADIDPYNTPSIRLCERLGFRYEGTLRNRWHTHIGVRDAYMMSLVEGDGRPWRQEA